MKRFIVGLIVLCVGLTAGCAQLSSQKDVYYVMFSSQPILYDTKVYFLGTAIGDILTEEIIALNSLKITINIDSEYREMIKESTVFYEDMGKLNYATVSNIGKVLEPGAKLLGFDSKISMYWFKTRTVLSQSSAIAARRANQLYQQGEKQN